jgi:putative hydrolase of the HAD superfamily
MPSDGGLAAVTLDANGTLLRLADPAGPLREALLRQGARVQPGRVREAFAAEVAHYLPRAHEGRDAASLAALRRECVAVFLAAAGAELDPEPFVPDFLAALRFEPLPGVADALRTLRARGLALACVANWDVTLPDTLARAGLAGALDAVVSSAEAGAPKPDPAPFRLALGRLGVKPARALHCGDEPADAEGARAAGLRFASPPVSTLPARLAREAG